MNIKKNKQLTILIFLSLTMMIYLSLVTIKNKIHFIDKTVVRAKEVNNNEKLNEAEKFIKEKKEIYNKQITMNVADYMNKKEAENIEIEIGPETKEMLEGEKQEHHKSNSSIPLSRGGAVGNPVMLALTFYTDTHDENGGWGGYVANNKKIAPGMVASGPQLKFGTEIYIPSFGKNIAGLEGRNLFVVEDSMLEKESYKTNGADYRIDIYVPRLPGEADEQYKQRVNSYGRYNVQAFISDN